MIVAWSPLRKPRNTIRQYSMLNNAYHTDICMAVLPWQGLSCLGMDITGDSGGRQGGSYGVFLANGNLVLNGPGVTLHQLAHWGTFKSHENIYNHCEKM